MNAWHSCEAGSRTRCTEHSYYGIWGDGSGDTNIPKEAVALILYGRYGREKPGARKMNTHFHWKSFQLEHSNTFSEAALIPEFQFTSFLYFTSHRNFRNPCVYGKHPIWSQQDHRTRDMIRSNLFYCYKKLWKSQDSVNTLLINGLSIAVKSWEIISKNGIMLRNLLWPRYI